MKFYLFALGCKVNGYENNALRELLLKEGGRESPLIEADLIVLNTCAVTGVADQKSRQHIRKLRRLNEKAVLAIMGCYSETHALDVAKMGADIVIGTTSRNKIVSYYDDLINSRKERPIIDVKKSVRHEKYEEMGQMALSNQSRAYLKIQDGCDNFCSYCLIPSLRGNSRSRDYQNILSETKALVEKGYKEIVLTGIHIGKYGLDLGDNKYLLPSLCKDILINNPSLCRLRLGSLESKEITEDFANLLKDYKSLVNHFHIPLQSGSTSVLERMHRPYDVESFYKTVSMLREVRPNIALTTDIIVGFPGESEEEWQETLDFVRRVRFSEIHVFPFSARSGTLAASLPNQIDPATKEKRVHELLALSKELRKEYERTFYDKEMEVLFEDYKKEEGMAYGHSDNYLLVKIPSSRPLHGEILKVVYDENSAAD